MNIENLITKFSFSFTKRPRIIILMAILILVFGYTAYSDLLKREGFPAVNVPFAVVNTAYFVDNQIQVNEDITIPIEQAISDLDSIDRVQSTTTENFSVVQVIFKQDAILEVVLSDLKNEISNQVELPEGAQTEYQTFNAGTLDGSSDFLLSLSASNKTTKELQNKAQAIAVELTKLPLVEKAEAMEVITTQINPITGEEFTRESNFNRVGFKHNGELIFQPAINIGIKKTSTAGTIDFSKQIRSEISKLHQNNDLTGYNIVYTGDFAVSLQDQIDSLEESAIWGLLIIGAILLLFINWRAGLILALFFPMVLGAVFATLYLFGYTLNTISLFSLILVLGIFVDDGIIVVEAIDYYKRQGLKSGEAIKAAIDDIGIADVIGTITTLLVFIPMLFISGILGEFIWYIPATVIIAMILSLFMALTVIPFLSKIILTVPSHNFISNTLIKAGDSLGNFIKKYLQKKRYITGVIILSLVLIAGGGYFATLVSFSVFPASEDAESLIIEYTFNPGTTVEQAKNNSKEVESIIKNTIEDYVKVFSYYSANENSATVSLELTPMDERETTANEISEKLNKRLERLTSVSAKARPLAMGPPEQRFPFAMQVYSSNQDELEKASEEIANFLQSLNLNNEQQIDQVEISGLENISKRGGDRYIQISASFEEKINTATLLEVQEKVENRFNQEKLSSLGLASDSLGFDFGMESENLESFESAIVAMVIAIALIYILLLLQFNSFLIPLLILLALPFALPGVMPGLYFTNNSLSFFSFLGVIAMTGVVVNNTIMLMEFIHHALREGKSHLEAVIQAIKIRFRPILATTATTVGGLLPLGLTDPFWESLAFTVIFGLISSAFLVLITFPAYYMLIQGIRSRFHRLLAKVQVD